MYFKNLWFAFVVTFQTQSFRDLLLNIDRFGNAFCGGHYKLTVSGRVGYFAFTKGNTYWRVLQKVIDNAFYPLDGERHCFKAYKWEKSQDYRRGNDVALAALSVVVFVMCLLLAPVIWLLSLFGVGHS